MSLKIPGPIGRHQSGLPTPDFISAEQTVTINTKLDVAHGLGAIPRLWLVILRCDATDAGFAAGDEVLYATTSNPANDSHVTFMADATNLTVSQGALMQVVGKSSFNATTITTTKWRWVVRAWR